ncbi:MAG: DUF1501 domain-containing protein [Verrucomicrobiales bacterium]|nr:DUF1501 domain-containing protein [Verrucomicrobiales bacterium]
MKTHECSQIYSPGLTRRDCLSGVSAGFGYAAFSALAAQQAQAYQNPLAPKSPHFPGTAKRVIFACMRGGPSHVDTFDFKPQLAKNDGKTVKGKGNRKLKKSPWGFKKHGESGLPISALFPQLAKHADDLCLLNGMYANTPAHPQAFVQLHTGSFQFVRPSLGAWSLYGLGTENENLPGFITLAPPDRVGGAQNYGSAFLPALYQGTKIGDYGQSVKETGIANLKNNRLDKKQQRAQLDFLQSMNRDMLEQQQKSSRIEGVIESYELAFRMQAEMPDVMNLNDEPKKIQEMYGIGKGGKVDSFGRQCLMARRFAEAGVRFIELSHGSWDQHNGLSKNLTANCRSVDQPLAALLADLKQRDMLKDTLVIWGGEFGRTPHVKRDDGRDHNATGFSFWMAGGGVKGGMRYGATDENGIAAVENRTSFHDFHATILHTLGLDHEKLTYRYAGRDFRLTDVHGEVMRDILI